LYNFTNKEAEICKYMLIFYDISHKMEVECCLKKRIDLSCVDLMINVLQVKFKREVIKIVVHRN